MAIVDVEERLALIEDALFPAPFDDECCGDPDCAICCDADDDGDPLDGLAAAVAGGVIAAVNELVEIASDGDDQSRLAASNSLINFYFALVDRG